MKTLYLLLLLLIPITVLVTVPKSNVGDVRSKAAVEVKKLYFWPIKASLAPNQTYDLEIRLESVNKPSYVDLVLKFDSAVINIVGDGPLPGNIYSTYYARYADNSSGIAGIGGKGEIREGTVFEKLKIKTIQPGNPNFSVNYINSDDKDLKVDLPQLTVQ